MRSVSGPQRDLKSGARPGSSMSSSGLGMLLYHFSEVARERACGSGPERVQLVKNRAMPSDDAFAAVAKRGPSEPAVPALGANYICMPFRLSLSVRDVAS